MGRRPPATPPAAAADRPEPDAFVPLTADDDAERLAAALQTSVGDALTRVCELARALRADAPQKLCRRLDQLIAETATARDAVGAALASLARGAPPPRSAGDGTEPQDGHAPTGRHAIRLLVIDDQPVVRKGLVAGLRAEPDIALAGEAHGVEAALGIAVRARPDVVVLDYRVADTLAPEAVPRLRSALPGVRIVVFTAERGEAALEAVLRAGIDGLVFKDWSPAELFAAVRRVVVGETVMDPRLPDVHPEGARPRLASPLTRREYEVLRRVAMGETNVEISVAMGLSRNTIKTYLQKALHKLGARNRIEALARAREAGLL